MARANNLIRAFLAIEVNEAARASLTGLIHRLRKGPSKVSWVPPENLHLTLRFLGDVPPSLLDDLSAELTSTLREIETFDLRLAGVGVFPDPRRPSVIWAGVHTPPAALAYVHGAAEHAAQAIGLDKEPRPFRPHITLGRVRTRTRSRDLIETLKQESDFEGGEFPVRTVSLFSSHLAPSGVQYQKIRGFPLACSSLSE